MGIANAASNEQVTLTPSAGLTKQPDPVEWKKLGGYLTRNAQIVYLYLRWLAADSTRNRTTDIKTLARGVGDSVHGPVWHSRGTMTVAVFRRALLELEQAGLVEADSDAWD